VLTAIEPKFDAAPLVLAAQAGDRGAFGSLYQQYGRLVHGVLLAYVPYRCAEDLVQDVFLKALEQLPSLREPAAFPVWLLAIARRAATDFLRSKKHIVHSHANHPLSTPPDAESFAILSAIQTLPETYRETLLLRLVEGMTGPEIAAQTGLTHDSVRVNLCRGMKLLRDQLKGGRAHA
jgi:RNA polymerase sigma-70 factor, ECF subfamily